MSAKPTTVSLSLDLTEDEIREVLIKRGGVQAPVVLPSSEIVLAVGRVTVFEAEKQLITQTLASVAGHRGKACAALGISRPTLTRKLKAYGVEFKKGGAA